MKRKPGSTSWSRGSGDFEQLSVVRAEAGDPPDFFNFPQPDLMADMARDGFLVDHYSFLSQDDVSAGFTDAWVSSGLVDGELVGLWHGVDVKSLVWYPKQDFEEMGFAIPQTWDELIGLTDDLVARGASALRAALRLVGSSPTGSKTSCCARPRRRTTTRGLGAKLAFSSPEVKNAFEMAGEIFFNPDYVLGGTTGILTTAFGDSPTGLFEPRSCYLHRQASFIPSFFPEGGRSWAWMSTTSTCRRSMKPTGNRCWAPVTCSAWAKTRPLGERWLPSCSIPALLRLKSRPEMLLGVHTGIPDDWYPSTTSLGFAQILANADTFRFDGSDLMPGAVGAGSLWTGVTDWIGGADLDEVLAAIDASWPQ